MADIIKKFKNWLTGKEDFKVYFTKLAPKSRFRRAGKTKGKINWQVQVEKDGDWLPVTDKKIIEELNGQYQKNLAKKELQESIPNNINSQDYWTLITVIAAENYPDILQGMADVAQSIYNRFKIPDKSYGNSIAEVILKENQYEPVKIGKRKGAAWGSIKSKKNAISVYARTKGVNIKEATRVIDNAITAQKDKNMRELAHRFIGTRTEFLANNPSHDEATGMVQRGKNHNVFFWRFRGKDLFLNKGLKIWSSVQIPDSVNVV